VIGKRGKKTFKGKGNIKGGKISAKKNNTNLKEKRELKPQEEGKNGRGKGRKGAFLQGRK